MQTAALKAVALLADVQPGMRVIDFCAGAGGKTLAMAAQMQNKGRILAWDTSEKRLAQLPPRLRRAGVDNVQTHVIESENDAFIKRHKQSADRVLVDAPCSGLGTLRRNPDLKWRQSLKAVEEMSAKQSAILDSAAKLLKSGGRLVYATCSLLSQENEVMVQAFSHAHPDFVALPVQTLLTDLKVPEASSLCRLGEEGITYLRLWPHVHQTDGFFAAVWQKK